MEPVFVAITIVALALAVGMAALGWKLLHDDRLRSAARVDALRALGAGLDPDDHESATLHEPAVTAHARFSTLDEIDEIEEIAEAEPWDGRLAPPAVEPARVELPAPSRIELPPPAIRVIEPTAVSENLFATARVEPTGRGRRSLVLAAVATVMIGVAGTTYAVSRGLLHWTTRAADVSTPADAARAQPLELLSLRNSSDPDGTFVVTGLVGNPSASLPLRGLVVVVYLFDHDGNYFAGNRSPIDLGALQPGDASPFVVRVPAAAGVSRYRVGFRLTDGAVVAHVDRRGQPVDGLTEETTLQSSPGPHAPIAAGDAAVAPTTQAATPVPVSAAPPKAPASRTHAIRGSGQ